MNNTAVLNNEQFALITNFQQYTDVETGKVEYVLLGRDKDGEPFGKCGDDIEEVKNEFFSLIEKMIANPTAYETPKKRAINAGIKFKRSECRGMDKAFKKEFIINGLVAGVEKRENDDGRTFTYTIRYRSNTFKVEASSTDLREAKRLFVAATNAEGVRI